MKNFFSLEQQHGLPRGVLQAIAKTESNFRPDARSPKGALGMFQFMPNTVLDLKQRFNTVIDPMNPEQAAKGAAVYMKYLLKKFGGNMDKALAAYNWGEGNVQRKGVGNLPKETRNYLAKIKPMLAQQDQGPYPSLPEHMQPPPQAPMFRPPVNLGQRRQLGPGPMSQQRPQQGLSDELIAMAEFNDMDIDDAMSAYGQFFG